jgi:hypothetical protein
MGVNEGVNITHRGQFSPWGPGDKLRMAYHVSSTDGSDAEMVDGGQNGPEASGLLRRDSENLGSVLDAAPSGGRLGLVLNL